MGSVASKQEIPKARISRAELQTSPAPRMSAGPFRRTSGTFLGRVQVGRRDGPYEGPPGGWRPAGPVPALLGQEGPNRLLLVVKVSPWTRWDPVA